MSRHLTMLLKAKTLSVSYIILDLETSGSVAKLLVSLVSRSDANYKVVWHGLEGAKDIRCMSTQLHLDNEERGALGNAVR